MTKTFVIAEVGINHNGQVELAKKMIDGAIFAGCDAVKFQKRTIDEVYTKEELDKFRESPWGTTNREQKYGLEFEKKEYDAIDAYCKEKNIYWFASAWDVKSQLFLKQYDLKYNKVASAMLTNKELLETIADEKKHTFIAIGMSTLEEVDKAVAIFRKKNCPFELMQCNSCYPAPQNQAHLRLIPILKERYGCNVGYSSHHAGIIVPCAAVALGATSIEAHITLDRSMYGSDQAASIEVVGFAKMVKYIRGVEESLGEPIKIVTPQEEEAKKKLRRVNTL